MKNAIRSTKQVGRISVVRTSKIYLVKCLPSPGNGVSPKAQQERYLKILFGRCSDGYIEIRPIPHDSKYRCWIPLSPMQIPPLPLDKNIFIGVATRQNGKGTKDAIIQIPAVWADIDFKATPEAEAKKRLASFSLKPSIHVHSGHGWHLYWLLKTPAVSNDIPQIEDINQRISNYFDGDHGAKDASRVLRLPGTMNVKYSPPRLARLVKSDPNLLHKMEDFLFLPPMAPTPPMAPQNTGNPQRTLLYPVSKGERNKRTTKIIGHFLGIRTPISDVQEIIRLWNTRNNPPLPTKELEATISSIYKKHIADGDPINNQKLDPSGDDDNIDKAIETGGIEIHDLINMSIEENPLILKPWLRTGNIALITAQRGVGKTWLGLSIGVAVSHDFKIGKWEAEKHVGCCYVDGEMSGYQLKSRFLEFQKGGIKKKAPLKLFSSDLMRRDLLPSPNFGNPRWRDKFFKFLAKNDQFKLVILDNIVSLTPQVDENTRKEWDPINQWLLSLRALDVSVIMIHHTGKSGAQRGTSSREDNIDVSMTLTHPSDYKAEDGVRFDVKYTKTRGFFGADAEPCCLSMTTLQGLHWDVKSPSENKANNIIAMLNQGIKQKEIAKIVGCQPPYVTTIKKIAMKSGFLNEDGTFTDEGENRYGDIDTNRLMET